MSLDNITFSHEQYEPIEEIGRGGMGIVYRCMDRKMEKNVAVKVLAWNLSDAEIIRFHKEAKALGKMQHPNILRILDCGHSDDDSLFIVLDLLNGTSLSDILARETVLPFDEALSVFSQICDGLLHAHRKNILHRDVKPSNVFIERSTKGDTKVVITDFGLAKLLTEDQHLTKTGIGLGSPPYMSPEQAAGKNVDERSDIYSFGCLMFECLTGERPFSSTTVPQLLMMHVRAPAPTLADRAADRNYPDAIERIIAKCLAKEPSDRYQSVSDLSKELQSLRDSRVPSFRQHSEASGRYTPAAALLQERMKNMSAPKTAKILVAVCTCVAITGVWLACKTYVHPDEKTIDSSIVPNSIIPSKKEQDKLAQVYGYSAELEKEKPKPKKIEWIDATGKDGRKKLLKLSNEQWNSMAINGSHADYIDMSDSDITDADLENIGFIPLIGIKLINTRVGDKTFEILSRIPTLKDIYADGTAITDKGLLRLTKSPRLARLTLSGTGITDFGVRVLGTMKELTCVSLSKCKKIRGITLEALQGIKNPLFLSLSASGVERKNLPKLALLKNVYNLDVSRLNLTDDDLVPLTKMPNLSILMISENPRITREGFLRLAEIKTLSILHAGGCPNFRRNDFSSFLRRHGPKIMFTQTVPKETDTLESRLESSTK